MHWKQVGSATIALVALIVPWAWPEMPSLLHFVVWPVVAWGLFYTLRGWMKDKRGRGRVELETPQIVILFGITIAVLGVGWQIYRQTTISAQSRLTDSDVSPETPKEMTVSSYDVPIKLGLLDTCLKLLREDVTKAIDEGYSIRKDWKAALTDKHDYLRRLRDYQDKWWLTVQNIANLQKNTSQYADIHGLLDQTYKSELIAAVNDFRNAITAINEGVESDIEVLMEPRLDKLNKALSHFADWRNDTEKKILELRKRLSG